MSENRSIDVAGRTTKVLLVEDSPTDARLITLDLSLVQGYRFEVVLADTLTKALAILKEVRFDVALIDLGLPDSSGFGTFMKVQIERPELPIVVLTGLEDESIGAEAIRRGVQDYLVKGTRDGRAVARAIRYAIERKRTEEALRDANVRLAEADRRKDEFLAMLAHELRNPLAPMRNAMQVMRMLGNQEPAVERQRDVVDRQITHMARLLDDLMDVSRVTRGKIDMHMEILSLATVVAHAVEMATPLMEARGHTLNVELPSDDILLSSDSARLAQVIGNLLNNAAKYTDNGGQIWLSVSGEGDEVVLRVRDTGLGIGAEMLTRVFDLFAQADQSQSRSQGGLGIGLTLVRSIVEMHHGRIEARSAGLGKGSEFIVHLPILTEEVAEEDTAPDSVEHVESPMARKRVLVVDDLVESATSLAQILELWGHEVNVAHDGLAALEAAETFHPDVVLLDIAIPRMNGFEVARRLRQSENGPGMLLIAQTGYDQESNQQKAVDAGFDHHLRKPIDLAVLRELLAGAGSSQE